MVGVAVDFVHEFVADDADIQRSSHLGVRAFRMMLGWSGMQN